MATVTQPPAPQAPASPKQKRPQLPPLSAPELAAVHALVAAAGSWLGGVALHQGWHLNVPFGPTWMAALAALLGAHQVTRLVGRAWHQEKLAAAPQLALVTKAAEHYAAMTAPVVLNQVIADATKNLGQ